WLEHSRYTRRIAATPVAAPPTPQVRLDLTEVYARQALGPNVSFPVKVFFQLRNESRAPVAVELSSFEKKQVILKQVPRAVLQVKRGDVWWPEERGLELIAVAPAQYVQGWLGIDETRFSVDVVKGLIGHLGTLVLSVNGELLSIPL